MKNSLKLIVVLLISINYSLTRAQSYCVKGGMTLANIFARDNDDKFNDDNKPNPGFMIGGTVDVPLSNIFSMEPGLIVLTKGNKVKFNDNFASGTYRSVSTLYYIDVPLNLKASFKTGKVKLYYTFGPYIGFGLYGSYRTQYPNFDGSTIIDKGEVEWDNENGIRRLDYGLTAGSGVEFRKFQIGASYGFGLANLSSYHENGFRAYNRVFSLSLGYRFGETE